MKNLEDKLQQACVTWFRLQYPNITIFSIPNGGSRNAIEAAKLKRTGALAGVADLFVMKSKHSYYFDSGGYIKYGLFIELKVGKNSQTDAQREFASKAMSAGYFYQVCRSFDEFKEVIENYLS